MTATDLAVVWRLPDIWRGRCLDSDGRLLLYKWLADGAATIIKHAPHRTIYRVRTDEFDFYLKEYRTVGLRGWLRELIRPNKAKCEYNKARQLSQRGIAVPNAIGWGALGNRWLPRASFLHSETLAGASALADYLSLPLGPLDRQSTARRLGMFVAQLHRAGAIHRDFHPSNMLVQKKNRENPELFLIDLHEVQTGRLCSWHELRNNLITLNRWFILRSSRSDRLRFWRAYQNELRCLIKDHSDDSPKSIELATRRSNAEFWIARQKRYGARSRHVKTISGDAWTGLVVSDASDELRTLLQGDINQLLNRHTTVMLKDGGASTVARISNHHQSWILKRFNIRSRWDLLKNGLRKSPAHRSWLLGHALLDAGLPTARPLAVMHARRFGLPAEGWLITEALPKIVELRAFADQLATMPIGERSQISQPRIAAVARTLRLFHERHFGHRDLKAANLLTPSDLQNHQVWFVDLVGVTYRRHVDPKSQARDLARLLASFLSHPALTLTDRLRFLRTYLNWHLHGKMGWKRWWREISEAANAKVQRNQRRNRVLA